MFGAESCRCFVPATLTKVVVVGEISLSVLFTELQVRQSLLTLQLRQKLPCSSLTVTFSKVPEQVQG